MDIIRVFCKDAINKKLDAPIEEDLELDFPEGEEELDEAKKKKKKIKTTYTTGSIAANIDFFNKHNGTDDEAGKDAAADTNADMGQSGAIGGDGNGDAGNLSGGEGSGDSGASGEGASAGGAMGESLTEAKRYVKRYYIKPQNIFCSNKEEILKALIEYKDEDLTIYTLVNLTDHDKDVTKLTNDDIIYYYYDGILYDKNHIRVLDYDLAIKREEDRKKFTQEGDKLNMDNTEVKAEYEDRMTDANLDEEFDIEAEEVLLNTFADEPNSEDIENPFELDYVKVDANGDIIEEDFGEEPCVICGEPIVGYGNNAEPYKAGRCCDACNAKFVIPARLQQYIDYRGMED